MFKTTLMMTLKCILVMILPFLAALSGGFIPWAVLMVEAILMPNHQPTIDFGFVFLGITSLLSFFGTIIAIGYHFERVWKWIKAE